MWSGNASRRSGGLGQIPFVQVLLDGENCDHTKNTAGTCADETKAGPLKGPGTCDDAYYWFTGGNMNVELSDGSYHYCQPESEQSPMTCAD
ncbi:hypothetical protein BDV27DRAFT_157809 [Aspergillus caelatus]|uniref:Uncharacterized protein n=1 Tax=Aspergillus caelatus TaxID=61420 RepID=A0A5N7A4J5_9EURO|nr:uncharacterized protein BDV27DRAFT_157809 [Aspergillus caelatus]KAE8364503.1 hypothetical protein BDV27DRAFT_157809 [Aspergillus caelatus]